MRQLALALACAALVGCGGSSGGNSGPTGDSARTQTSTPRANGDTTRTTRTPTTTDPSGHLADPGPSKGRGKAPEKQPSRAACLRKRRQLTHGGGLSPEGRLTLQAIGCGYLTK